MTGGAWLLVALAGAAGAVLRHEVTDRARDGLVALHVCNAVGAFALGVVLSSDARSVATLALAAGGLGAFTSFSSWVVAARGRSAGLHLLAPLVLAVAAAVLGLLAGAALGDPA
jgi:fluoride ion exporter CrcB/FEX